MPVTIHHCFSTMNSRSREKVNSHSRQRVFVFMCDQSKFQSIIAYPNPLISMKQLSNQFMEQKFDHFFPCNFNYQPLQQCLVKRSSIWKFGTNHSEIITDIGCFRSGSVRTTDKCSVCSFPLVTRSFYLFPCQHKFHSDCLIAEVGEQC